MGEKKKTTLHIKMASTARTANYTFSQQQQQHWKNTNKVWIVPEPTTVVAPSHHTHCHERPRRSITVELHLSKHIFSQDNDKKNIINAIHQCMKDNDLPVVDLLLVELPSNVSSESMQVVWREMERYVQLGFVKRIGLLNAVFEQLVTLLQLPSVTVRPDAVQIHSQTQQLGQYLSHCKENKIKVIAGPVQSQDNESAWSIKYNITLPDHSLLHKVGYVN